MAEARATSASRSIFRSAVIQTGDWMANLPLRVDQILKRILERMLVAIVVPI